MVWCGVVHSTWPSWVMWHMHALTFNKWHKEEKKKNKNKKVALHILTHGAMRGCGLTSLVVCINDKIRDIRERNVTIRSEIWTTNTRSLRFRDIREWVTFWGLILRRLGCVWNDCPKLEGRWCIIMFKEGEWSETSSSGKSYSLGELEILGDHTTW